MRKDILLAVSGVAILVVLSGMRPPPLLRVPRCCVQAHKAPPDSSGCPANPCVEIGDADCTQGVENGRWVDGVCMDAYTTACYSTSTMYYRPRYICKEEPCELINEEDGERCTWQFYDDLGTAQGVILCGGPTCP